MTTPADKVPDPTSAAKATESVGSTPSKPPSGFDTHMQGTQSQMTPSSTPSPSQAPGPASVDRPPGSASLGPPTHESLLTQTKAAQDTLGNVKNQLKTPNLKFKRSQSHLLKNKLQDANDHIRAASQKLGINPSPLQMPAKGSALERFLTYIDDGQNQIQLVQQKLKDMSSKKQQLNPADLLFAQVKLSQAQQEIEYSSTLLGKVVDSIKTVLNIQL